MPSEAFYKKVVVPVLDRLDSETMHKVALESLHLAESTALTRWAIKYLGAGGSRIEDARLKTVVGGVSLDNPTVVAAGWDKPAKSVRGLFELGFGGIEIGSVLEFAQPGNPKPRQFVVAPGVAINALGFNSPGMEVVAANLMSYRGLGIPIGVNIGKNKEVAEQDAARAYAVVASRLYDDATYFVVNVSSPNTPGLRKLQDRSLLLEIIAAVKEAILSQGEMKPTFVKIAPDLTNDAVDDVIDVVVSQHLAGIIATNTTNSEELKASYGEKWRRQPGGLSGDDPIYRQMSTEKIAHIYRTTKGKVEVMGVGGVKDGKTALEKIQAGAKAVQVMTAFRGEGPGVARKICLELLREMERLGVCSIAELVGTGV
jgi:dihydroorotate dehydrogenase